MGPWTISHGERTTDYATQDRVLRQFRTAQFSGESRLGLPYGIGCEAAQGDWTVVAQRLTEVFVDRKVIVFRWRLAMAPPRNYPQ